MLDYTVVSVKTSQQRMLILKYKIRWRLKKELLGYYIMENLSVGNKCFKHHRSIEDH